MPVVKPDSIKIVFFPGLNQYSGNPYWTSLAEALAGRGAQVEDPPLAQFSARWLRANRGRCQVLHFHYIQQFYAYEAHYARLRWVLRFGRNLLLARLWGYRTVVTMHNLQPTYPLKPAWVDYLGHWVAFNLIEQVIVHCQAARRGLASRYWRKHGVHAIPHPNLVGLYPNSISPSQARSKLGLLDDDFVFLYFGGLRLNKGIQELVQAFSRLAGDRLRLIIAGEPGHDPAYLQELQRLGDQDQRIRIVARWIPDEEIQNYMHASDVVVLPFSRITTSGSTILAMSFGKPVIVPELGCLPELVSENSGFLYRPLDVESLEEAMRKSLTADLASMGLNAYHSIQELTWQSMAQQTLKAYGF